MKLGEIDPAGRFFGLFVGDSGAGKTCAALSFPTPGLLIDIDLRAKGGLAARQWLPEGKLNEWEVIQMPPGKGFKHIEDRLEMINLDLLTGRNQFKTIVIDSLTTESRLFISDALTMDQTDRSGKSTGKPVITGKIIGNLRIAGPGHYGYEQEAMAQVLDYLKGWPLNVICSAHIVPKYGKIEGNEYGENVVVGEQLALREKVSVRTLIHFDEVYKFGKMTSAGQIKRWVKFQDGDLAKTAYPDRLPTTSVDITARDFYSVWQHYIAG